MRATPYGGTSLIRKRTHLGPYCNPMPRVLGGSKGSGRFFMGEVPLHTIWVPEKAKMHIFDRSSPYHFHNFRANHTSYTRTIKQVMVTETFKLVWNGPLGPYSRNMPSCTRRRRESNMWGVTHRAQQRPSFVGPRSRNRLECKNAQCLQYQFVPVRTGFTR